MGLTVISPWLASWGTLLFNRRKRGILPTFRRPSVLCSNDESYLTTVINRQPQLNEDIDDMQIYSFYTNYGWINYGSAEGRWYT